MARGIDVGPVVDADVEAGDVHAALLVLDATADPDPRKQLLRKHPIAVGLGQIDHGHPSTSSRSPCRPPRVASLRPVDALTMSSVRLRSSPSAAATASIS